MAKIEVSSLQGWIPLNINPIRVLTTSGRKPPLLPNTQDLHAEKDAEDGLCQGQVGLRTHRPDGHNYVLQAHDAQFPIESLAKLGEQMKQLPKGWQYRTRALTEDLVLDLGPDKTIYAVGDEFHQYYTRIAETK